MTSWRPLLTGPLATRALAALEDLGDGLLAAPANTDAGPGLGPGTAGLALAHAYLDELVPGRGHLDRAAELTSGALDWIARTALVPWLFEGWTGVGYLLEHVERHFFELDLPADQDPRRSLDAAVARLVAKDPEGDGYEYFLGHAGHGLYALARAPRIGPGLFEAVLAALEHLATREDDLVTWFAPHDVVHVEKARYPRGHYNLGVAHGIAGCLGVLVSAHAAGVARGRTRPLIEGAVRWLERQRLPAGAPSVYPWILAPGEPPRPARTAWCDGDPGVAAVLLRAGLTLGQPELARRGLEVMHLAAARPPAATAVIDAGLCHGGAGLAHVYNRAAQLTGDAQLADAARSWYAWTLDQRRSGEGIAGWNYRHQATGEWGSLTSFTMGAAGTALALAAGLSATPPAWDELLLLS